MSGSNNTRLEKEVAERGSDVLTEATWVNTTKAQQAPQTVLKFYCYRVLYSGCRFWCADRLCKKCAKNWAFQHFPQIRQNRESITYALSTVGAGSSPTPCVFETPFVTNDIRRAEMNCAEFVLT